MFDDRAKKLASDLKQCVYYETCSTYGLNVERVFHDRKLYMGFVVTVVFIFLLEQRRGMKQ